MNEKKLDGGRSRRVDWSVKWGLEMIIGAKKLLKVSLREITGMARYMRVKCKHLGDDAAGTASAIGLDGSGGRGLGLWGGGDGEEGNKEIH